MTHHKSVPMTRLADAALTLLMAVLLIPFALTLGEEDI